MAIPIEEPALPPYAELEKKIRGEYDWRAVFTWDQYSTLLTKLSEEKFLVLPLNEMRKTYDPSKVIIGLRHDIDWNPFKALEMADMEKDFGFRATYFFLPTADYYGTFSSTGVRHSTGLDSLIRDLYGRKVEIGMHNDLLTVMIEYGFDPLAFNLQEMNYFSSLGITITGTASHGSPIAKVTVPNYQIFSNFATKDSVLCNGISYPIGKYSLKDYGFEYEAYFIDFSLYLSEASGKWNDPQGFTGILESLEMSMPGDRIQILTHPEWWGR
ncbi:MAG: hypothetical protein WCE64_03485 [Bacteroidales bacterium]